MHQDTDRRSFLGFAVFGLGAIFSAILGFPIVAYVIDPRHRTPAKSEFKPVDSLKLDELTANGEPRQGVIRDTRRDGWTLYPNDVVGRVWVVQTGARPTELATMSPAELDAFNADAAKKSAYLRVFTTICPHLGCSVNLDSTGGFRCPCHDATFTRSGDRATEHNPAARGMDTLEWQIDPADPDRNRLVVKYESYRATLPGKELV